MLSTPRTGIQLFCPAAIRWRPRVGKVSRGGTSSGDVFYALDEVQGVEALLHLTALGFARLGPERWWASSQPLLLWCICWQRDEDVPMTEQSAQTGSCQVLPVLLSVTELDWNAPKLLCAQKLFLPPPGSQQVQPELQTCAPTKSPHLPLRESRTKNACGAKSINPSNLSPKPQQEGANYPTANWAVLFHLHLKGSSELKNETWKILENKFIETVLA